MDLVDEKDSFISSYKKDLHFITMEAKGNIRVYCRVRPIIDSDLKGDQALEDLIRIEDNQTICVRERDHLKQFKFDRVLGPATT